MELKDKFKFRYYGGDELIFYAKKEGVVYAVGYLENDKYIHAGKWETYLVKELVGSGKWILIEVDEEKICLKKIIEDLKDNLSKIKSEKCTLEAKLDGLYEHEGELLNELKVLEAAQTLLDSKKF